jgi:hypothetical protein
MECPLCGTVLDLDAKTCFRCDAKLDNIAQQNEHAEKTESNPSETFGGRQKEGSSISSGGSTGSWDYKSGYGVTRGVCSFISFLGWLSVIVGGIIAFIAIISTLQSGYGSAPMVASLTGVGTVFSGFMMIMGAQVTRATVDNADHTREILAAINRS